MAINTTMNRRRAIQSTAAVGALALPAGAAVAAVPVDAGLVQLEAGYREWQDMLAEADRLEEMEGEYLRRARDRMPEFNEPEPEPQTPKIAKLWEGPSGLVAAARDPESYVTIPQDILDQFDAFREEWKSWEDRRPRLSRSDPDYRESLRIERRKELLWKRAERLRVRVMKIPTTSPCGLLIKLALATDTPRLEDFDKRFRRSSYYDTFGGADAEFFRPLLADLRALAGRAAA